jgi:hypothetical protein
MTKEQQKFLFDLKQHRDEIKALLASGKKACHTATGSAEIQLWYVATYASTINLIKELEDSWG